MPITVEDFLVLTTGLAVAVFISGSILHYITTEIEYHKIMNQKPARKKPTRKPALTVRKAQA